MGNQKLVQKYLGHSDVATALRYYVGLFQEDLEEGGDVGGEIVLESIDIELGIKEVLRKRCQFCNIDEVVRLF